MLPAWSLRPTSRVVGLAPLVTRNRGPQTRKAGLMTRLFCCATTGIVVHNENYYAARGLALKPESLARRGAWRSQSQSAPGRRGDLLSSLIEHNYPPAQIPVNGLLTQPRRRAVRHGSDGQQGIDQRLLVSVGNLQSHE